MRCLYFKKITLFCIGIILFCFSFSINGLKVVNQQVFEEVDLRDESMIVGRLLVNEKFGIFSQGLFNGTFSTHDFAFNKRLFGCADTLEGSDYSPYYSQPGGQSLVYALFVSSKEMSFDAQWKEIQIFNVLIFSSLLMLFVFWVYNEFNLVTSLLLFFSFLIFPVFVTFAKSPWWCLWSFYLPMIVFFWYLSSKKAEELYTYRTYAMMVLLFLVKYFLTGFEFVIPVLGSLLVPLVYYTLKNNLSMYSFKLLLALPVLIVAVFVALFLLVLQIAHVENDLSMGISHVLYSFTKRSNALIPDVVQIEEVYTASKHASIFEVFNKFMIRSVFYAFGKPLPFVSYYTLFLVNFFVGVIVFVKKQDLTLFVISIFAFIVSLAWFVIFKGHAAIHGHLDEMALALPWVFLTLINMAHFFSLNYKDFFFGFLSK